MFKKICVFLLFFVLVGTDFASFCAQKKSKKSQITSSKKRKAKKTKSKKKSGKKPKRVAKKRKISRRARRRRRRSGRKVSEKTGKRDTVPPTPKPVVVPSVTQKVAVSVPKPDIEQLKVLSQGGVGGGASCGYHALKNGILIARYFNGLQGTKENLIAQLNNSELVNDLFGQEAKWRSLIRTKRNKIVLQYLIGKQLKEAVLKPKDYRELQEQFDNPELRKEMNIKVIRNIATREVYISKISDIALKWADEIVEKNITIEPEKILIKTIEKEENFSLPYLEKDYYIKKEGEAVASRDEVITYIKKTGTIKLFIDIKKLKDIKFSMENLEDAYEEYNIDAVGFARQFPDGDWLNDAEIENLRDLEKKTDGMLYGVNTNLAVIQDIDAPHETTIADARESFKQHPDLIYIFVLGTMSVSYPSGMGHWFTVVVHQSKGHKKFITTDSLGINRTEDSIVKKLIEGLE